jgi:hypothetical protein
MRSGARMMNRIARKIDRRFFDKKIQKWIYNRNVDRQLGCFSSGLEYRFIVFHQKNRHDLLAELCDKYGSDKGQIKMSGHPYRHRSHTYTDLYSRLFSHCRLSVKNVFECGLGTNNPNLPGNMGVDGKPGASLRVWRDYFPNAMIYGGDIDKDILFEEERIRTFYLDQLNADSINEFWERVGVDSFDFMIDDGLHTFDAGICLLMNSVNKLSANGIYIIEDVTLFDLVRYREFFNKTDFSVDYIVMFRPGARPQDNDNNLIAVRCA